MKNSFSGKSNFEVSTIQFYSFIFLFRGLLKKSLVENTRVILYSRRGNNELINMLNKCRRYFAHKLAKCHWTTNTKHENDCEFQLKIANLFKSINFWRLFTWIGACECSLFLYFVCSEIFRAGRIFFHANTIFDSLKAFEWFSWKPPRQLINFRPIFSFQTD